MRTDPFGQEGTGDKVPRELVEEPHWYACRTRARAEKRVDELLDRDGFETFLPLVERERQWADRKKTVAFPMFPGYTFARFPLAAYRDVLRTPGIVHVVSSRGRPVPVRPEELESVRRFARGIEATGRVPDPVDYLEPGTPIVVEEGPFQGMRGVLLEGRGPARVAVRLGAIRAAVSVQMDRRSLRAVER